MIGGRSDLIAVNLDPDDHPDEWLESRRKGIGGSDAPAVIGEHPQKSAIQVWEEKALGVQPFIGNERTETGKDLEPVVLGWYCQGGRKWPRQGEPLAYVKPPTVYRKDTPWIRGSADAFLYYQEAIGYQWDQNGDVDAELLLPVKPNALGEVKTHGWFGSKGYILTDEGHPLISVPPDKRIQCAWYMHLYDIDVTHLICLVDTHLKRAFTIHRDRELEAMIVDAASRFWHEHVLADIPPAPDGSEGYRRFLANRWLTQGADYVEPTEQVEIAVEALLAIKRDQKKLEKDRELAEQVIKAHIGDNEGIRSKFGRVSWKFQPSGKLREKDARAELYLMAGLTDDEIDAFEARYAQPDHRVLRTPK